MWIGTYEKRQRYVRTNTQYVYESLWLATRYINIHVLGQT